ncbi:MAG: hypothetical protein QNJ68_13985 [Microcoleaceae cyanobacterium MO_207.B10]|nr:hypothetical protein [Microcoleaceae cyanobacterium MO_207.B10]
MGILPVANILPLRIFCRCEYFAVANILPLRIFSDGKDAVPTYIHPPPSTMPKI